MSDLFFYIFGSKLRARILGYLFTHTDERFYVRQLAAILLEDAANTSRELSRLAGAGLITVSVSGKQKYYQANQHWPAYEELHRLALKTFGITDIIKTVLQPFKSRAQVAFIFGSIAGGSENRSSDIDLLIVGRIEIDEIISALSPVEHQLNRQINTVIYSKKEFSEKILENSAFLQTVIKSEKIFIIGDNDDLVGLVKSGLPANTQN
jgi:uncharacterized protein